MNFEKKIMMGLTAGVVGFSSLSAIGAENRNGVLLNAEPVMGNAVYNIKVPKNGVERVKVTIPAQNKEKKVLQAKTVSKVASKCSGPTDIMSFSNPPKKKFGNDKKLKDCGSKEVYKSSVATLMSLNYGKSWENKLYSVGPIETPLFISSGKTFAEDVANRYKNSLSDKILVYNLIGKKGPRAELDSIIKAQTILSMKYPLVDLTQDERKELNLTGPYTYKFDIDGNGVQNELKLAMKEGKMFVLDTENKKLLSEKSLDNVRYEVLSNVRDVEGGQTDAFRGYMMTAKNQGREVVRFMVDTNKVANETLTENAYIPVEQTKFANLEGLVTFIDKVANMSERADYIDSKALEALNEGKIQVKSSDEKKLLAYSSTFGDEVPVGLVALYFTAGSAIYTVLNSDYLPTVKASDVMTQVRGSRNAVNLDMLLVAHKNKANISKTADDAYLGTKSMYNAQFKASEKKVMEVKF